MLKLPKQCRISLCSLRTNNHRLPIVTGRYNGIPKEERYCNKCNNNVIGDEFHVLLECNDDVIRDLRAQYIPVYYRNNPCRYKFIQLMQNDTCNLKNNLALFCKKIIDLFH